MLPDEFPKSIFSKRKSPMKKFYSTLATFIFMQIHHLLSNTLNIRLLTNSALSWEFPDGKVNYALRTLYRTSFFAFSLPMIELLCIQFFTLLNEISYFILTFTLCFTTCFELQGDITGSSNSAGFQLYSKRRYKKNRGTNFAWFHKLHDIFSHLHRNCIFFSMKLYKYFYASRVLQSFCV